MALPIVFSSDYGEADPFAGICRLVLADRAPGARVIDLTHAIGRHDTVRGSLAVRRGVRFAPRPSVHLAIVDPGVGTDRRAVAVLARDDIRFVGPDTGLLAGGIAEAGGAIAAVEISGTPVRLDPVSETFHGRDVFAPVAAALTGGAPLEALGDRIDPAGLTALPGRDGEVEGERVRARVLEVDGFGNVALAVEAERAAAAWSLGARLRVTGPAAPADATAGRTFADAEPGALVVLADSWGQLAIACRDGDAAARLGAGLDDLVMVERA